MSQTSGNKEVHYYEIFGITGERGYNCRDGRRMGCIADMIFDEKCGSVTAVILQSNDKFFGLFGGDEIVIPWNRIKVIGKDVVIIDADIRSEVR